ncbi:MAG: hypothetical protein WA210_17445, partial [Burkholderiaceae bacterium]
IAAVEFARARTDLARTGRTDLLARAELLGCAARVASLVFDGCAGFAALAQDAPAPERAYASYLEGTGTVQDAELLPPAQRDVAAGKGSVEALGRVADPLSRLVAAGVLLRSGRAEPALSELAVDTASAQGWRRPLLAWLNVQLRRAQAGADANETARLRRRIELILGDGASKTSSRRNIEPYPAPRRQAHRDGFPAHGPVQRIVSRMVE